MWLLAVPVVGYVGYEISNTYDTWITKPYQERSERKYREAEEENSEKNRKEKIERIKDKSNRHKEIRSTYNLKEKNELIKIINNTDDVCNIFYVSDYYAKNEDEAISYSKKVLASGFFDFLSTKKEIIGVNNTIEITKYELEEYYVVLNHLNSYIVLKQDEKDIRIKERLSLKNEVSVNLGCKSWF